MGKPTKEDVRRILSAAANSIADKYDEDIGSFRFDTTDAIEEFEDMLNFLENHRYGGR